MAYRIGSFNMFKFSFQSDSEIRKDIVLLSRIIRENSFDIIALQEVFSPNALARLLDCLGRYEWDGVWDSPRSYSSVASEGYGFIWNKRRMRLATTELPDGTRKTFRPHIYNQYRVDRRVGQTQLIRNPYYARFEPQDGSFCELRLINTHIMFAKGKTSNLLDIGAVTMRKHEFDILTQVLYSTISDKRYGNNRPAYTIILGDYNLNLRTSGAIGAFLNEIVMVQDQGHIKRLVTVQDQLTTLKAADSESQESEASFWANNYDHFTYDIDRFSTISATPNRIDSVKEYCDDDYKLHRKIVSDHVPVLLDINLK